MPIPNLPASPTATQTRQSEVYSADLDIYGAADNGTGTLAGCAVTASSLMTLAVAAGTVASQGIAAAIAAGTVTVTTADATNPRIDLVVATSAGAFAVRAGTAAASPVMASLTSGDVALAQVDVAAGVTTITSGMLSDRRITVQLPGAAPYLFLPPGWDTAWKTAKAGYAGAFSSVACLGDSTTMGTTSTGASALANTMTQPWWAVVRAALVARYALGGDFYPTGLSQNFWTAKAFGTFPGTPPFSAFSASANQSSASIAESAWWTSLASPQSLTFTTPYACTDIDIIGMTFGASNWTYTVDGGGAVTHTATGANTTNPPLFREQITGLASATHTIVMTQPTSAATASPMFLGCCTYPTHAAVTAGLGFAWSALPGVSSYHFGSGGNWPADPALLWQGASGGSGTAFGFPAKPSLAFIGTGINDMQSGGTAYGLDGFEHTLRRVIQAMRRGVPNCSIVLYVSPSADGVNSDTTSGTYANTANWPLFIDRMYHVAQSLNCAVVNIHAKWGETGVASGFTSTSDPHPTVAGMADIANTMLAIL